MQSPFISEIFAKTSRQVMNIHGQSCQVREQTGGVHSHAQLVKTVMYLHAFFFNFGKTF